ncbi:hypothetical protein K438DRAFT_1985551 [Mycena galopus ATCC 62051]|nr:hypothetical protein K438DRAFT_1985551 [Mycena galopus ATCC 62051]
MTTIFLRRRLAELDTQIAEHRRELRKLEEARTAVERELHATPFPVLKLPAEITAEIFTHCLPHHIYRADNPLIHARLTSLTVKEGTYEILRYLTLPALRHLDISWQWEKTYDELKTFLMRSSPPLISLFVVPRDDENFDWARCLAPVARTLENIHFIYPSTENIASFLDLSPSSLPSIRTFALEHVNPRSGIDYHRLVRFLYSWSSDSYHLRSFRLHWKDSPFFDAEYHPPGYRDDDPVDTINEHLSRLARAGMDIYLGTQDKNYAPVHGRIQNSGDGNRDAS